VQSSKLKRKEVNVCHEKDDEDKVLDLFNTKGCDLRGDVGHVDLALKVSFRSTA
jgi:hypothetical protein